MSFLLSAPLTVMLRSVTGLLLVLTVSACSEPELPNHLRSVKEAGKLTAGIEYAPSRYEYGPQGPRGFDYTLIAGFADYLGVELALIPYYDDHSLHAALAGSDIDLIVSSDAGAQALSADMVTGPAYAGTAWAFSARLDDSLRSAVFDYFATLRQQRVVAKMQNEWLTPAAPLQEADIPAFILAAAGKITALKEQFSAYDSNAKWTLLAAFAWQLNQWEDAGETADAVEQLLTLHEKIPSRIPATERMMMTLAAWRTGLTHLEDCRELTSRQGGNNDRWLDVKQRYPLLAVKDVYRHLDYGYADGADTVRFTENIQQYATTLETLSEKD